MLQPKSDFVLLTLETGHFPVCYPRDNDLSSFREYGPRSLTGDLCENAMSSCFNVIYPQRNSEGINNNIL